MKEKLNRMYEEIKATEEQKNKIISSIAKGDLALKKRKVINFPKVLASVASMVIVIGLITLILINPFSTKNSFYITAQAVEASENEAILSENAIEIDTQKSVSYGLSSIVLNKNYKNYINPLKETIKTEDEKQIITLDFMTFEGENIDTITLTPNGQTNIYVDNFVQIYNEDGLKEALEKYKDEIIFYEYGYEISNPEIAEEVEKAEWIRYFEDYSCVKSYTSADSEYELKDLFSETVYYADENDQHYFGKSMTFDYEQLKEERPIIKVVDVVKSEELEAYRQAIIDDKNEFSEDSGLWTDREQTNEFLKLEQKFLDDLEIKIDVKYKDGSTEAKTIVFETELWDYTTVRIKVKYS